MAQAFHQHGTDVLFIERLLNIGDDIIGVLDSTTMRLPNVGPGDAEIKRAEDGMRASGLL